MLDKSGFIDNLNDLIAYHVTKHPHTLSDCDFIRISDFYHLPQSHEKDPNDNVKKDQ